MKNNRPIIWLGQSVDTSSICSVHAELSKLPFLTSLGCAIRKPSLKHTHFTADLKSKLGITGPLMIDSGGFALMMNPSSKWSVRDVSSLMERIEADIFVSLDHPPSKRDTASVRNDKISRSSRNFRILSERFASKIVMPVIHGRTISEIDRSIYLTKRQNPNPGWIGLGGIVPLLQNRIVSRQISRIGPEAFIASSIAKVRRAFPAARIHAFGAGGTRTFPAVFALGADSGDSIGWRQAAGFGSIFLPMKSQRAVRWNKAMPPPRKVLDASDIAQLEQCKCPICASHGSVATTLRAFKRSFADRSIHNAWILSNQFEYWPSGRSRMLALVRQGVLGSAWAKAADMLG